MILKSIFVLMAMQSLGFASTEPLAKNCGDGVVALPQPIPCVSSGKKYCLYSHLSCKGLEAFDMDIACDATDSGCDTADECLAKGRSITLEKALQDFKSGSCGVATTRSPDKRVN